MRKKEKMLLEQGLKYLPEGSQTKISVSGVPLKLAYRYSEDTYIENQNELIEQRWDYYAWNKVFKRWLKEGGYIQILDKATYCELKNQPQS